MNTILKFRIYFILALIISGCEANDPYIGNTQLVLEGFLFQNEPVDSIHLTQTISFENGDTIYPPVTNAQVIIFWKNNQYLLSNIGNGYYSYSGTELLIHEMDTYSISVIYGNKETTSTTIVPKVPTGVVLSDTILAVDTTFSFGFPGSPTSDDNGIKIAWDDPENSYYYVAIENAESNANDIVFDTGDFPDGFEPPSGGMFSFRSEPFKGNEYTINSRTMEKYGLHKVKIYRVNQEYADLYENRTQDSRNLTEPLTNIKNGLGIFTAFSYTESSFYVVNKSK